MRFKSNGNRDLVALAALFILFIAAVGYYNSIGEEVVAQTAPSSLNSKSPGTKALYLLYQKIGLHTNRLETNWRELSTEDAILIVTEPLEPDRSPTSAELGALHKWVEEGGTVLWAATELPDQPERPLDPKDPLAGDVAIVKGNPTAEELKPLVPDSPFTQGVDHISMQCGVRLKPETKSNYETLFQDKDGAVVLHKVIGKGHLLLTADDRLFGNASISEADNALFAVDVVETAVRGNRRAVEFDEYHHGAGSESASADATDSIWKSVPLPVKLAMLALFALAMLLVYNGNRRLLPVQNAFPTVQRQSTDYMDAMARLLRRAHAADVAAVALLQRFRRDLSRILDLSPDAPTDQFVQQASRRIQGSAEALSLLLDRGNALLAGERIGETELLNLAHQMDEWRRRLERVGI